MTFGLLFVITCLVKTDLQVFWSCKIKFLANVPPRLTPSARNRPFCVITGKSNLYTALKSAHFQAHTHKRALE